MADSDRYSNRIRVRASAFLLATTLALPAPARAEDGTVRVYEAALNAFAAAAEPLTITRTFTVTLWILVPNPFLFGIPTPAPVPFRCNASGSVTGLTFDITPSVVTVRGNLRGSVCGVAYSTTISSPVIVTIDSARRLVIRPMTPMTVAATVNFLGFNVAAPFSNVSVAPSLSVVTIPLNAVPFELETPNGPRTLALVARNHQLSLHDGYFEIKVDASFR
jgi:hypothetical protein